MGLDIESNPMRASLLITACLLLAVEAQFSFNSKSYPTTDCSGGFTNYALDSAVLTGTTICFKQSSANASSNSYMKHTFTCGSSTANYTRLDWSSCNSDCSFCASNSTVVSKTFTRAEFTNLQSGQCFRAFEDSGSSKIDSGCSQYGSVCSTHSSTSGADKVTVSLMSIAAVLLALCH